MKKTIMKFLGLAALTVGFTTSLWATDVATEQALRDAFAAGGTVTLTSDITITEAIPVVNTVTLNLGTYTITGGDKVLDIKAGASLTINADATNPGGLKGTCVLWARNIESCGKKTVKINGGVFDGTCEFNYNSMWTSYTTGPNGEGQSGEKGNPLNVQIYGGRFLKTVTGYRCYYFETYDGPTFEAAVQLNTTSTCKFHLYGGRFKNKPSNNNSSYVVQKSGYAWCIDGDYNVFCNPSVCEAKLGSDNYFTADQAFSKVTGTQTVTLLKGATVSTPATANLNKTLTIDLNGKIVSGSVAQLNGGTVVVKDTVGGGSMDDSCITAINGYAVKCSTDGTTVTYKSGVGPELAKGQIGDEYYFTANEAISSAKAGDTVIVKEKVTVGKKLGAYQTFTVVLGEGGEFVDSLMTAETGYKVAVTVSDDGKTLVYESVLDPAQFQVMIDGEYWDGVVCGSVMIRTVVDLFNNAQYNTLAGKTAKLMCDAANISWLQSASAASFGLDLNGHTIGFNGGGGSGTLTISVSDSVGGGFFQNVPDNFDIGGAKLRFGLVSGGTFLVNPVEYGAKLATGCVCYEGVYGSSTPAWTVKPGIASVDSVFFKTVQDAFDAVTAGKTVIINRDCDDTAAAKAVEFILNPNGKALDMSKLTAASGYQFVALSDGRYVHCIPAVAVFDPAGNQIGSFGSLQTACDNVPAGSTVRQTAAKLTEGLVVSQPITIDLAGNVLSAPDAQTPVLTVKAGTCGVVDFVGGGIVSGQIVVKDGAKLEIFAGTFDNDPSAYVAEGLVARADDPSVGPWTVGQPVTKAEEIKPEAVKVDEEAMEQIPDDKKEDVEQAVKNLVKDIENSFKTDPVVAATQTHAAEIVKENQSKMAQAVFAAAEAQGKPLSAEEKQQVTENIAKFAEGTADSDTTEYLKIETKTIAAKPVVAETEIKAQADKLVYEVEPIFETVTVKTDAQGNVSIDKTIPTVMSNEDVEKNPVTFSLQVFNPKATQAMVLHQSEDPKYPDETFSCPIWELDGKRYITITTSHFSTFTITYSEAVYVASEATIGILKVERNAAGDIAVAAPFLKSGVADEASAAVSELVVSGAAAGDSAKAWTAGDTDADAYAPKGLDSAAVPGEAFWYSRAAADIPMALGGLVDTNTISAAAVAGTEGARGMTLFANPFRDEVNVLSKLVGTPAEGDQIVVEGGATRYTYADGKWWKPVTGRTQNPPEAEEKPVVRGAVKSAEVTSVTVPAGKAFWYVSASGAPSFKWQ